MPRAADSPAAALVRAINEQAKARLPRMQLQILIYLADGGYVSPKFFARADLPQLAEHFGRTLKSVDDATRELVRCGAVLASYDEHGQVRYSYAPDWRPSCAKDPHHA